MVILGLGVYLSYSVVQLALLLPTYGVQRFRSLRVSESFGVVGKTAIILTYKGCDNHIRFSQNSSQAMSSSAPLVMDGFKVSFTTSIRDIDCLSLMIYGSNDDWRTSETAGSLNIRWNPSGVQFLRGCVPTKQAFDLSYFPPWPWFLYTLLDPIFMSLLCIGSGSCGIMMYLDLGRSVCVGILSLLFLNAAISAIGFASLGLPRQVFSPSVNSIIYLLLACTIRYADAYLIDAFTCLTTLSFASTILDACALSDDCSNLLEDPPIASATFAVLGALFVHLRRRFHRNLVARVGPSQAAGDSNWELVTTSEPGALNDLAAVCHELSAPAPRRPRQLNRLRACEGGRVDSSFKFSFRRIPAFTSFICDTEGREMVPGELDEGRPITSLDQLYAQALGAAEILSAYCAEWAALSDAVVDDGPMQDRAAQPGSPTQAERAGAAVAAGWWEGRRCIKPLGRAVEKAAACYGGDASHLLDVCRARLVFGRVADLVRGLQAVRAAPGVVVARVKNGLSAAYDSRNTAAYRVRELPLPTPPHLLSCARNLSQPTPTQGNLSMTYQGRR